MRNLQAVKAKAGGNGKKAEGGEIKCTNCRETSKRCTQTSFEEVMEESSAGPELTESSTKIFPAGPPQIGGVSAGHHEENWSDRDRESPHLQSPPVKVQCAWVMNGRDALVNSH